MTRRITNAELLGLRRSLGADTTQPNCRADTYPLLNALEELAERRECVADVESLHAQYLSECEDVDDSAYEDCDDATMEARHHAQTCALAHALWILKHSREEREQIRREVFNRADGGAS